MVHRLGHLRPASFCSHVWGRNGCTSSSPSVVVIDGAERAPAGSLGGADMARRVLDGRDATTQLAAPRPPRIHHGNTSDSRRPATHRAAGGEKVYSVIQLASVTAFTRKQNVSGSANLAFC
jgi:hypothetical protein